MGKNIIRRIWEIRGQIDLALDNKDINRFEKAKMNFYKIFLKREHIGQLSAVTINVEYETEESFNRDCEANFSMIAFNINELRKTILGESPKNRNLQFNSILEVLWYTRDVYDMFVNYAKNGEISSEENLMLFSSIDYNFREMLAWYSVIEDEEATQDWFVLQEIHQEVLNKRDELYPDLVEEVEV